MKESNIKLIHLQNQGIDINPFTSKFNYFVLYEYLFKGTSMKSIEDDYFHNESGRGFDASRVLAYFKIPNTEENKNIYNGLNVSDVSKFLLSIPNIDYQKIGEALSKKEIKSTNNSVINSFQKYYEENLSNLKVNEKDYIEKREKFKKEYPLESIKELSLNEYVLGSNSNKESLCYKLEYGEYKNAGPGIGGATAAKFGIYKHKDNEFYGKGNKKIENPEHYWQNLRYQLYMFLKEFKTCEDTPIKASEKYPMLSGMGMVLTKLLYIYYPDKVVNICSRNKLLILMRYFGYECGNDMQPEELSFLLNKNIRRDIPETKNNDSQYLGSSLWHFIDDVINDKDVETVNNLKYTVDNFLDDVFMNEKEYLQLRNLLEKKKNIILQGPPGTGKTYMAKRLAYSIIGEKDDDKILSIQFHQSYSYEDFIEGIRPNEQGNFIIVNGIFKDFVNKAKNDRENKYYCIIDEINRGNLSKILGELMKLIESDKRDQENVILPYSKEQFTVPSNLYIIGTMNTADRSLSMVDYALRRRFAFYSVAPACSKSKFKEYLLEKNHLDENQATEICNKFNRLNNLIKDDLGKGFEIGHSYFVDSIETSNYQESYNDIINYEIKPLIEEYWFDDENKVNEYEELL